MESRGQDKDLGLPYSMSYDPPPNFNSESSAKLLPALAAGRRRNEASRGTTIPIQTLDQHQHNPSPQPQYDSNPNSNPDPDPVQVASATIPSASNSKTAPPQPQPLPLPLPSGANASSSVRYRECLKNHAASMGGHVTDGCGEFMPSGEEGTPEALRCAACDCHRNFHRKEGDGQAQAATTSPYIFNHTARHNNATNLYQTSVFRTRPQSASLITMPSSHQQQQQHHHQIVSHTYSHGLTASPTGPMVPMMMAFGGNSGGAAESSSEDLNMFQYDAGGQAVHQSKKRHRTKFTQQQKDRMHEFAEKLGWKIQKQDEQEVQQFCNEVGVKRQVFKVWMHNNKQAMKKKQM